MHRSTSIKRNTDVALPQRHGSRSEEHRTGLPYVPSTPSTRSSSSRSSSELPSQQPTTGWEHRPQLSCVTSMGRQKIVPTTNHRSPMRAMRNATSPLRQASPPQYPKGPKPVNHAKKEAPPYYDDQDDEWDDNPYFQNEEAARPRNTSPSRMTMVMTNRTPATQQANRRMLRHSPNSNGSSHDANERPRLSHHSQNSRVRSRTAAPSKRSQDGSFTTASLSNSSSSSSKRHLLRPNALPSDSSFRNSGGDAASLRTTSTGTSSHSGTRMHPSSRNSRLAHSVQEAEEEYDAASFNDDDDEGSVVDDLAVNALGGDDDHAFLLNASFVSIDFGSTVGVAPPVQPLWSQPRPQHYPPQQQHRAEQQQPWNNENNFYGYGEEEDYLDDNDDALLFHDDPHGDNFIAEDDEEESFVPPIRLSEAQKLERAVRRGSSLASSSYQDAAVVATHLTDVVRVPEPPPMRRTLSRSSLSKRHLQGGRKVTKAAGHADIAAPPQRRSSVSKASSQGVMPSAAQRIERVAKPPPVQRETMKPSPRDMPVSAAVSRRRSSLQHNPQMAASYRGQHAASRAPHLQRSRSYDDDDDFYGLPRGYDVAEPPRPQQRTGLSRTLSQPDLFDWKETDVDDMSFSDLAIRNR